MPLFDTKDKTRRALFSRRALISSGGIASVFTILAFRLYQLQIMEGHQYAAEADQNRISERLIAPLRGRIFDRFAVTLAEGRPNYRVLLIPDLVIGRITDTLDVIDRIIPLPSAQRDSILRAVHQGKPFLPVVVADNIGWDAFARVNLDLPYLSGVIPDINETRFYPDSDQFSHVLGYVASVSPADKLADHDPLLDLPGFRVGKRGIEKQFDLSIRGKAGISRIEVNAYGRPMRQLSKSPGTPGKDVYLTIDREVQTFVHSRLGEESAACAVMDVENGDVIALASKPGFDPNLFNTGITADQWNALESNDHAPMTNKVISGLYPPGSTFKPATALAAIDAGIAKPGYTVVCSGIFRLGNHDFHCWRKGGHGRLDMRQGLKYSCDIFFYETALRTGIDNIARAARALGFGESTGIEIPGEKSGLIPTPAWKEKRYGAPWLLSETLMAGIGQGYVLTTPLQLCTLAARIASGKTVSPRLVYMVGDTVQSRPTMSRLGFSEDALALVRSGMSAVTNEPGGTAYAWRIAQKGFEMAGKTGTAQVHAIAHAADGQAIKRNAALPWKLRDHALFIAYAPTDRPRYACSVVIEHGATVSHEQVQMARDILLFTQTRDPATRQARYPVVTAIGERTSTNIL